MRSMTRLMNSVNWLKNIEMSMCSSNGETIEWKYEMLERYSKNKKNAENRKDKWNTPNQIYSKHIKMKVDWKGLHSPAYYEWLRKTTKTFKQLNFFSLIRLTPLHTNPQMMTTWRNPASRTIFTHKPHSNERQMTQIKPKNTHTHPTTYYTNRRKSFTTTWACTRGKPRAFQECRRRKYWRTIRKHVVRIRDGGICIKIALLLSVSSIDNRCRVTMARFRLSRENSENW